MSQQRMEFLINNGDPRWLAGAAAAPTKIQNLLELNARLAHQPWTIQCDLITVLFLHSRIFLNLHFGFHSIFVLQKLLKGSDAWSVAELVHAIVILTTYHFLSCVSHGVGIATDNDLLATPGATFADAVQPPKEAPSDGQTISPPGSNSGTRRTGTRLAQLLTSNLESLVADVSSLELEAEVDPASIPISIAPVSMPSEHRSPLTPQSIQLPAVAPSPATEPSSTVQPVAESVPAASPVSDAIPFPAPSPPTASQSPTAISIPAAAPWLIGNHISSYVDFDMKKCELLREQDYSWKEHGFALVNRFYLGAGPLLDAELDLIFDYTENNLGDGQEQLQNVDTGPFRRAIWYAFEACATLDRFFSLHFYVLFRYYAHRMFGMVAADFDYRQVNVFLSRPLKAFIKRVVCFPHTISAAEFDEALSGT
jgi:sestrin